MSSHAGPANWWTIGTNEGRTHIATKGVVQSGLVLNLDAGVNASYPGTGTSLTDLSSNGITGTLTNGPTYSSDNSGYFAFDGVNDYAILNNNTVADSLTDMTVSIWVYRDWTNTYGAGTANTLRTLISKIADIGSGAGWSFELSANRTLTFFTQQSGGVNYSGRRSSVTSLTTASWANFAASYSGGFNGLVSLYLNGNELTTTNFGSGTTVTSMSTTANVCYASRNGGSADTSSVKYNNIRVSVAQIYNRQLSAAEIQRNFNATRERYNI
jgi:hypothetical protein